MSSAEPAPVLVAVLGLTATGKSALGIALAERFGGEVVSCDSAAVYRGFDIGTDKVPPALRRGVPHHLVDLVEPTAPYSAADYARDAAAAVRSIQARGRLPILVGGTGFYYRALTRGLFAGPGRDPRLRARVEAIAARRGVEFLHRIVGRLDPESAVRIHPRDRIRLVRAIEVFFLTGRPLTSHFAATASALEGWRVVPIGLRLPMTDLVPRLARRVDDQFARGIVAEVRGLLGSGVPEAAHPFRGLVYRQVLEFVRGERDEAETRALILRENKHYARRQLIWFRKEPNLVWFEGGGEAPATCAAVVAHLVSRLTEGQSPGSQEDHRR